MNNDFLDKSKPYIDAMLDYLAIRPTSTLRIPVTEVRD